MSFTENGLSMHVVARNGYEWNEFSKSLSRQLSRGFGPNYLPARWDPDAEGYYEAEGQAEELEEDEYLVTVPVFSAQSLLLSPTEEEQLPPTPTPPVSLDLLQVHLSQMIQHLKERYLWLETEQESLHLAMLMRQFKLYLPLSTDASHSYPDIDKVSDVLSFIFILIAYVVSICLLPPLPNAVCPPLPVHVWYDCNEYATRLLAELMLAQGDRLASFPIVLCITLIAWIDHELVSRTHSKIKTTVLLQMAIRLTLLSNWAQHEPWQLLIASFIHLDVHATLFYSQPSQLPSSLLNLIWKPSDTNGVLLEARSMLFLTKVISLFYHDHEIAITRKVDVDDVLTLVRDIERFEQELPPWACWEVNHQDFSRAKSHFHLIHHITKILLFRPFCTNANEGQDFEQTFTKTTFLDLSIAAADRLSICLLQLSKNDCRDLWFNASLLMIKDVSRRAYLMFSEDREVNAKLTFIRERISCFE
ncbi:hypothetical protein EDC96DRAFT_224529 [Choanephora cucurbitarum]|nr:hypothetical protein EDC96DRAFT_224529 [Choanephora cucurbitarum]